MLSTTQSRLRIMGLSGILGGIILFSGDMLLYYNPTQTDLRLNMSNVSDFRILLSGISALLATWFYLFGSGQIYYAFTPSSSIVRNIVSACFASILAAYGVVHAAYIAIAATAKLAHQNGLDIKTATMLSDNINESLRLLIYPIFAILSILFIYHVLKGKTLYPKWIILFFPLIPFLLQGFIAKILSGTTWIIIIGGYLNLILILFFTASTIALWNHKTKAQ